MHTFLFEEGLWKAEGFFYRPDGAQISVVGEARILHQSEIWINEGKLVFPAEGVEILNRYEFIPLLKAASSSTWSSHNPSLGNLKGLFTVVENSILSQFQSTEGGLSGVEFLRQINPDQYEGRGAVFKDAQLLSSWAVKMERVQGGWLH